MGHVEPHDAIGPKTNAEGGGRKKKHKKSTSWHLNKKIRKVAKLEVTDAFELRGRVIAGLAILTICSSLAIWLAMKWLMTLLSSKLVSVHSQ